MRQKAALMLAGSRVQPFKSFQVIQPSSKVATALAVRAAICLYPSAWGLYQTRDKSQRINPVEKYLFQIKTIYHAWLWHKLPIFDTELYRSGVISQLSNNILATNTMLIRGDGKITLTYLLRQLKCIRRSKHLFYIKHD